MLALLALAVAVIVPPGFMPAAAGHGSPLVICTGHGPATQMGLDKSARHGKAGKADGPCVFAGHGLAPPLSIAEALLIAQAPHPRSIAPAMPDLLPGRGLAAPPPPSQGPPARL